jgi:hypothetical protein
MPPAVVYISLFSSTFHYTNRLYEQKEMGKATTTRGTGLDSVEQKLARRDGKEEEKEMRYPPRTTPRGFQFIGI